MSRAVHESSNLACLLFNLDLLDEMRNKAHLPHGRVLVVGGSILQLACETQDLLPGGSHLEASGGISVDRMWQAIAKLERLLSGG